MQAQENRASHVHDIAQRVWRALTEPVDSIQDYQKRHRAGLLSVLLLVQGVNVAMGALFSESFYRDSLWISFVGLIGLYGLSRTRFSMLAGTLAIGLLVATSTVPVIVAAGQNEVGISERLQFSILPILLASFVLPLRGLVATIILSYAILLTLRARVPGLDYREMTLSIGLLQMVSAISLTTAIMQHQFLSHRERVERQISASLEEKEVLLKEIHHRVKNNLQVISSLLNLQSDKANDPAADALLAESKDRVKAMSLIHEKLYQSSNLSRIDFGEYVDGLVSSLLGSNTVLLGSVSPRIETDSVQLDLNAAIPCGLIVNELVTNALKHAFRDGAQGKVWVELKRNNGSVSLTVGDDGVGLPDGWDIQSSESLGMQLVAALVGQLDARLTLNREGGTEFVITFGTEDAKQEGQDNDRKDRFGR